MAEPEDELKYRIKRIEAVVAALLVADYDVEPFIFEEFWERFPFPEPDALRFLLRRVAKGGRGFYRDSAMRLEQQFSELREDLSRHQNALTDLASSSKELQTDAHVIFALQSMGIDLEKVRIPRFLPVRVYIDKHDPEAVDRIQNAINELLRSFGLEVADDFPAQEGSWFKRWIARFKQRATQDDVQDVSRKIKRGLENAGLEAPQAEINETQARALGTLMEQAKSFDNAAIQAGTALVVVTTSSNGQKGVVGVTLTAAQVIALENNQELLNSPATLLPTLRKVCDNGLAGSHEPPGTLLKE
jgi:hypothetical protein